MVFDKNQNESENKKLYIDVKNDFSLYNRFYESVKILATGTGTLNKRLFDCYWNFLFAIGSNNFEETELKEKLKYVEEIFSKKSIYLKSCNHTYLKCHWKESEKMAKNIFYIYDYILETKYKSFKTTN